MTSSVRNITSEHRQELKDLHSDFERKARLTGCSAAAASFLLIGALIVITCGSLCLMLPGVNVIEHIILPAIIPGILAITVSIPFILLALKHSRDMNSLREQMIHQMINYLDSYKVDERDRKKRVDFILHNFLNWQYDDSNELTKNTDWSIEYQGKILSDIKEKIGKEKKERNPRQEKIATALDKARAKIAQRK